MLDKVKSFLRDNGYEYHEEEERIVVDCGGQDYNYVSLVGKISEQIEEWTYYDMMRIHIIIDTGFETIIFKLREE